MSDGDGPTVDPQTVADAYLRGDRVDDICDAHDLTTRELYRLLRVSARVTDEASEVVIAGLLQLIDMLTRRVEELENELSVQSLQTPLDKPTVPD